MPREAEHEEVADSAGTHSISEAGGAPEFVLASCYFCAPNCIHMGLVPVG